MKGVKIFLADGFEDIEALGTRDVLVRGGVDVELVSIAEEPFVASSHGVMVGIDCFLEDCLDGVKPCEEDVMIFPGGMPGSKNLAACKELIRMMNDHYAKGGTVAAICAAPGLVLSQLDDVDGLEFTCFDGFQNYLAERGAVFNPVPAITSGRIITGRAAGYSIDFALEILKKVAGGEAAAKARHGLLLV